jgi:LmbE family N-acetylglucosaminyl deacetylase
VWGFEEPGALDKILLLSPHLDDAVLSCGSLLLANRGATVATLFAASPDAYTDPLNEHDTDCGFEPGTDTMAARRAEDTLAMSALGAVPRWLPLCQNSHAERAEPLAVPSGALDAIVATIDDVGPSCVVAPLGLAHVDHQACHASALAASAVATSVPWIWYSDLPYVVIPGVLAARFRALHKAGFTATPVCPPVARDADAKWSTFEHYATQVGVLERLWRLRELLERCGEQYWTLTPS